MFHLWQTDFVVKNGRYKAVGKVIGTISFVLDGPLTNAMRFYFMIIFDEEVFLY